MAATGSKFEDQRNSSEMINRLNYEVVEWSSYSPGYHPRLIKENKPDDLTSRWLSDSGRPPQYVTLQLSHPAIVTDAVFGKYCRPHACNVHKLKILGGMDGNYLVNLAESELKNDGQTETVPLRHSLKNGSFPCLYIKIVLLDTWGQTNFSLWHVDLLGITDSSVVRAAAQQLKEFQQEEAVRLCLKHLRQNDYQEAFHSLRKQAHLDLEHPLLTELHHELVQEGDYDSAELIFTRAVSDGLLDSHISEQPLQAIWEPIEDKSCEVNSWPCARGGHQLCLDVNAQLIYLFGGWDGMQELSDFWVFNVNGKYWKCLSRDTTEQGGPSPRSCHKMCLDSENQIIYVIGRYLTQDTRTSLFTITVPGDFYSYSIQAGKWEELSSDTHADGGPRLLYDHQISFNPVNKTLYLFGGRVITSFLQEGVGDEQIFSGLYAYQCLDRKWVCLRPDYTKKELLTYPDQMKPRMAHTMVLCHEKQVLYIIGGQREKESLCDMWQYNVSSDTTHLLTDGSNLHFPAAGYTVRATFEPSTSELYLHMGISRRDSTASNENSNSIWVYSIETKKWSKVTSLSPSPCARYAYQLVYDPVNHTHYMFGGNPGTVSSSSVRLNDLWTMKVQRQTQESLLQKCIYTIRKQKYNELTQVDPSEALRYLKTKLAECVNHNNPEHSQEFRSLTSQLFSEVESLPSVRDIRTQLFDKLSSLFPPTLSQPRSDLINFIEY